MRVCYWGTYDVSYPRNVILISGLRANGVEVVECNFRMWQSTAEKMRAAKSRWGVFTIVWRFLRAYSTLFLRGLFARKIDCFVVGYSGHFDMPFARILCTVKRKPLIFDAFLSLYDSLVMDRKVVGAKSLKGRLLHAVDTWACRLANVVLLDTAQHIDYFSEEFGVPREKFQRFFIGADDQIFSPPRVEPEAADDPGFMALHYGRYIPLHGMPYIVRAAKVLEDDDVSFVLIGSGDEYEPTVRLAEELGVKNIQFIENLPPAELLPYIAKADVCLGIFGDTAKAARVIPNKVYECMAVGRPVITGDSPAARELLRHEHDVLLCKMADGDALAEGLRRLRDVPELASAVAQRGRDTFLSHASPAVLGRQLRDLIEQKLG